ncbi:MAG: hypothetical protein A2045_13855 [Rhodocyclales bacterium GWA2_65_20]|nr:MAG: hypothetical protein A2045_13855 [Rhodocyclales bacterium GWA2_65_20]
MNDHETDAELPEAECPFCGALNESCKHLIATFGVSEPGVEGGLLADHLDEVVELMAGFPAPEIDTEYAGTFDMEEATASLRAFLEQHPEVGWAEFSVEESGGIWDYANYWARYPGMVIDDLYRQLESAADGN